MVQDKPTDPYVFSEVVRDWQHRLQQLDRRNNLLYFKPGRSSVRIVDYGPDKIVQALSSSRHGLKFDYVESRNWRPASRFDRDMRDEDGEVQPYVISGVWESIAHLLTFRGDLEIFVAGRKSGNRSKD